MEILEHYEGVCYIERDHSGVYTLKDRDDEIIAEVTRVTLAIFGDTNLMSTVVFVDRLQPPDICVVFGISNTIYKIRMNNVNYLTNDPENEKLEEIG